MVPSDYKFRFKDSILGAQMLFVAFGALVLVPLITGLDPNVALFTAGAGTLLFQLITGGRVPVFLASSFVFVAPLIYGTQTWGLPGTLCGLAAAGVFYLLLALLVQWKGPKFINRILPPVVIGPVLIVIGLILAPVAVNMALGKTGDGAVQLFPKDTALLLAAASLLTTVFVSIKAKGMLRLLAILTGVAVGYSLSLYYGMVNFEQVNQAAWFAIPNFVLPEWNLEAVLYILPIAMASAVEHVGDMLAIRSVTNRDYIKKPGLNRTLLGDGLATSFAACLGGPPNTTYSEVTGAVALTRAFNPAIMTWAALTAVALAFVGKMGALLQTIPTPVMGGIMLLLFGAIATVGFNILVKANEDLMNPRNIAIVGLMVVTGVGNMAIELGGVTLNGIGLACLLGIILNLILPQGPSIPQPAAEANIEKATAVNE